MLSSECFSHLIRDLPMVFIVALGSYKNLQHILICMLLNLPEPRLHVIKRRHASRIEGKNDPICSLVVRLRDCAESLLPCRVPDLQLHALAIHLQVLYFKVDSYSSHSKLG